MKVRVITQVFMLFHGAFACSHGVMEGLFSLDRERTFMDFQKNIVQEEVKKNFKEECRVINLKYEYREYTGTEQYAIVSELSEADLWKRYPDTIQMYVPYVLLSAAQGQAIEAFNRNEDKFKKRQQRDKDILSFASDETERLHAKLIEEDFVDVMVRNETRFFECRALEKAFEVLTPVQKSRIIKRYVQRKTLRAIAEEEGIVVSVVDKSVRAGVKKLRKYFEGTNDVG